MAITKLLLNGVEYDIGVSTEGPQLYEGRELEEYTWTDLADKCAAADYSNLRIGDYKTITLTDGELVQMQIAGIDTYYRTSDKSIPHHVDFISKDCLIQPCQWNLTSTNNGNSENSSPWMISNAKNFLNNTIYNTLPSDLKNLIVNKRTLIENRYSTSGSLTESVGWKWQDIGYLWLPSEVEIFGFIVCGTQIVSQGQTVQYPIFANSYKHRLKGGGVNGVIADWWLCTSGSKSDSVVNIVNHYGYGTNSGAMSWNYVPVCFRITGSN